MEGPCGHLICEPAEAPVFIIENDIEKQWKHLAYRKLIQISHEYEIIKREK